MLILSLLHAHAAPGDLAIIREVMEHRHDRVAEGAPIIGEADYDKALDGDVIARLTRVDGVDAAKAWGLAVIDHPVDQVWKVVNNEAALTAHLPVTHSVVLTGPEHAAPRTVFEFLPLPLLSDRWWVVNVAHNEPLYTRTNGRAWEQVWTDATHSTARDDVPAQHQDGIPVAWTQGAWLLVALPDDRTLLEYYVWTDPGGSLPAGPATRFAAGAVRDTLRAVDSLCDDALTWADADYRRPDGSAL